MESNPKYERKGMEMAVSTRSPNATVMMVAQWSVKKAPV
jgi:hypothetical protein